MFCTTPTLALALALTLALRSRRTDGILEHEGVNIPAGEEHIYDSLGEVLSRHGHLAPGVGFDGTGGDDVDGNGDGGGGGGG